MYYHTRGRCATLGAAEFRAVINRRLPSPPNKAAIRLFLLLSAAITRLAKNKRSIKNRIFVSESNYKPCVVGSGSYPAFIRFQLAPTENREGSNLWIRALPMTPAGVGGRGSPLKPKCFVIGVLPSLQVLFSQWALAVRLEQVISKDL